MGKTGVDSWALTNQEPFLQRARNLNPHELPGTHAARYVRIHQNPAVSSKIGEHLFGSGYLDH